MTTETSIELKDTGDYEISGPSSSSASATMYPTSGAKVYETQFKNTPAPNKYNIYMSLPKPRCILVLDPVWARIYPTGSPPPSTNDLYAVGVRLFYDKAGVPTLRYPDKHLQTIPFYVAPCETQTNMQIGYAPYDTRDPEHADSKKAFHQVSLLWGLDLQVEFESQQMTQPVSALTMVPYMGPYHDCKCPVIGGSGGS